MPYDPATLLPAYTPGVPSRSLLVDGHEDDLHQLDRQELRGLKSSHGLGAGNPTANKVLRGTGAGTSAWGQVQAGDITPGTATLLKIAEVAGTGSSGVLEFSSIPATYRHLRLVVMGRSAASSLVTVRLTFETTPTAGSYNYQRHIGAAAASSADEAVGTVDYILLGNTAHGGSAANVHRGFIIDLAEYANTSMFKPVLSLATGAVDVSSSNLSINYVNGLWESTAAIDRIRLTQSADNWATTSRATLYGIPA